MEILLLIYIFLLGIAIGSFLNVVIERIPQGISVLKGRSHCDYCHHVLTWIDLIPVISFITLKSRCRYCHRRLSWQYPLIEILTGLLFVTVFLFSGSPTSIMQLGRLGLLFGIFSSFFALDVMDIKYGILPDTVVLFSGILSVMVLVFFSPFSFIGHTIVGLICFGVFLLIYTVTKGRGIGLGDVKLSLVMGLLLGFPKIIIALYIAFLTGACVALILVIAKRKKLVGGTIAFGPFLLLGTYLSWFFGETLWVLLLHLLGL